MVSISCPTSVGMVRAKGVPVRQVVTPPAARRDRAWRVGLSGAIRGREQPALGEDADEQVQCIPRVGRFAVTVIATGGHGVSGHPVFHPIRSACKPADHDRS